MSPVTSSQIIYSLKFLRLSNAAYAQLQSKSQKLINNPYTRVNAIYTALDKNKYIHP